MQKIGPEPGGEFEKERIKPTVSLKERHTHTHTNHNLQISKEHLFPSFPFLRYGNNKYPFILICLKKAPQKCIVVISEWRDSGGVFFLIWLYSLTIDVKDSMVLKPGCKEENHVQENYP